MVRPMTNCRPMISIAAVIAWRTTGSPERATNRRRTVRKSCAVGAARSRRPVSISAQVEALTKIDSEWPRWLPQSAAPILSRISRSTVSVSGMRSNASARHNSATPSGDDSAYSWRNASMPPLPRRSRRTAATKRRALSAMRSCMSAGISAAARMRATALVSSSRQVSRIAARSSVACGGAFANTMSMAGFPPFDVPPPEATSGVRPSSLLLVRLGCQLGFEAAERRLSLAPTELAGAPVPECCPLRIAAQTVQAGAFEKRRIVGHRHAHRGATVSRVGGALKKQPGRGYVPRGEECVAARYQSRDVTSGNLRPVRRRLWRCLTGRGSSWRCDGNVYRGRARGFGRWHCCHTGRRCRVLDARQDTVTHKTNEDIKTLRFEGAGGEPSDKANEDAGQQL